MNFTWDILQVVFATLGLAAILKLVVAHVLDRPDRMQVRFREELGLIMQSAKDLRVDTIDELSRERQALQAERAAYRVEVERLTGRVRELEQMLVSSTDSAKELMDALAASQHNARQLESALTVARKTIQDLLATIASHGCRRALECGPTRVPVNDKSQPPRVA